MGEIIKIEKYGRMVYQDDEMDTLRKWNCLCFRCQKLKPGMQNSCPIAMQYNILCQNFGNAFMMTRCAEFQAK
jgi:hypothetical protein